MTKGWLLFSGKRRALFLIVRSSQRSLIGTNDAKGERFECISALDVWALCIFVEMWGFCFQSSKHTGSIVLYAAWTKIPFLLFLVFMFCHIVGLNKGREKSAVLIRYMCFYKPEIFQTIIQKNLRCHRASLSCSWTKIESLWLFRWWDVFKVGYMLFFEWSACVA